MLAFPVTGQVTSGSVSGYVIDPASRPMKATVVASDAAHSLRRTAETDSAGFYRFADLPPSNYELWLMAEGFETETVPNLRVEVNASMRVDFRPAIAGKREVLTVESQVRSVPTESSELGAVIGREVIEKLPLNERDFLQLALFTPGVLPPVQDSELSTRGNFAMHAGGGREEFNNFLLDGVDNNDPDTNGYVLQPSMDAIQEFKIATNSYSAEYGRSAAGQVNVITRSGSNDLHGFAYEYFRNRHLDARNFFDGNEKPQLIRNQFGVGAGGPLVRHRTFFFADYDGFRGSQGFSRLATVPTIAERSGIITSAPALTDPFTQEPFPANQIPASRISPIARDILQLYPLPSNTDTAGNYLAQPVGANALDQFNIRLDQRLGELDHLTLRYSYGYKHLFEPYAEASQELPGFGDYLQDRGHNALLNLIHIFGPRLTNSLLIGFNRAGRRLLPQNYQTDVNRLWNVDYLPTRPIEFGYPSISVLGLSDAGDLSSLPIDRHTNTYQLTDQVALVRANHGLQMGAEFRKLELNGIVDIYARGSLSFLGALSGSGIGDLLLGLPTFGILSHSTAPQTLRSFSSNGYIEDAWKVRRDLTLNLGLRYEYNTPTTDPTGRMTELDLPAGKLVQVGTNAISRSGINPSHHNFAPRIGFAWNPLNTLVVRGGYGLFYDTGMFVVNSSRYFNPPYFTLQVFTPTATSLLSLQDPFPTDTGFVPPPALSTLAPAFPSAYLQHWNINLQRSFSDAGIVSIAYAGSKGTHLIRSRDLNQPPPGPGDVDLRRPYQGFSNVFFTEGGGNSNFHSLQVSANISLSRRVSIRATYMLSKSIDDTSAFLGTFADKNFPQDSSNFRAERAVSSFDVRNYGTASVVYSLPGRHALIRNTEVREILQARAGQPFTPILTADNSNTGNAGGQFGSDRPDVVHAPYLPKPGPGKWFDTSAFAVPQEYTFGNAGRNILRGPGYASVDVALARRLRVSDKVTATFEAQAFNALSRANFDLPQLYVDQPTTFGRIFSANPARQIQFAFHFDY